MFPVDLPPPQKTIQQQPAEVRAAEPEVVDKPSILKDVGAAMAGNFEPLSDRGQSAWDKFQGAANPPLTDRQRKAATFMHAMLEPEHLGGEDRTFNHKDADAVGAGIVDRTVKGTFARSGIAADQIKAGLTKAGVVEDPDAEADSSERKVSLKSLDNLEKAQRILGERSTFLEKGGLRVAFPGGVSQAAMTHILEGKFGLPPGAKIEKIPNWEPPK